MSDKQKEIINKLKKAIPNMTEFDKGYILGKTEKLADEINCDSGNDDNERKGVQ
jgi:hypothetical protein